MSRYLIIIEGPPATEPPGGNYSAYAPDLPGCVATGDTMEKTELLMREAIELHLEAMRAAGDQIPEPTTASARYVEVG